MVATLRSLAVLSLAALVLIPRSASAAEVLCDPSYQDCRALLIRHIQNERVAIDVAILFMEDDGFIQALLDRHAAGVRVRAIVEPRRNAATPLNAVTLDRLQAAGIPMRYKNGGGMLHWKFMIFDGQDIVQFSAANYSDYYFRPIVPYANYTDEGIVFTDERPLVDSFRRKFDDAWVDTTALLNYANVTTPRREYPLHAIDPSLSFVPSEDFATRSVPLYDAEGERIDTIMYKITESRHANGLIRAAGRGVPVRLITEPGWYRNPDNTWQAYQIDRLYMAGVQIRDRAHAGFLHQKSTLLYGQHLTIFGSSNWTSESNRSQYEHNYFTHKVSFFDWFRDNFERKWTNRTGHAETRPFVPLPPDPPAYVSPGQQATGVATTGVTLRWRGGSWAHLADVYFGTSPNPPRVATNVSVSPGATKSFALPTLTAGTTYYWKIVSKTMALREAAGGVQAFTTAGATTSPPPNSPPSVSLTSPAQNSVYTAPATIQLAAAATDADGTVSRVEFYRGTSLIGSDTTSPYQASWSSVPTGTYSLTARAIDNAGAVTASASVTVTVSTAPSPAPPPLPSPWRAQDIGSTGVAGSATGASGTFTVNGAGADIWGAADAFHFVWQPVRGDVDVIARVASMQNVHAWTKAGVMIRERLTADSPHAMMVASSSRGLAFQRRTAAAGVTTHTAATGAAPVWLKLERRGSTVTASHSADGTAWTRAGSDTLTIAADAYVGLAVTSHDTGRTAEAVFERVSVHAVSTAPTGDSREVVLHASDATAMTGTWRLQADSTAAGGQRAWNPDAGAGKLATALANPPNAIEFTFNAEAGRPYRMWIRGRAERNHWSNDSVHVQFSGTVDADRRETYRIGTTASAEYNLESCSGCGLAEWGWEDNGWGVNVPGPPLYFAVSGPQRLRIQVREDGLSFDQIVLSSGTYLTTAPGPAKHDATILPRR